MSAYRQYDAVDATFFVVKRVTGLEPVPPVWKTGMQPKTPRAQKATGGNRTRISAMARQYINLYKTAAAGEGSACFLSPYILFFAFRRADKAGVEPATKRLTAACSAV